MSSPATPPPYRLLIHRASQLVTITSDPKLRLKKGANQNELEIITNGSLIIDHHGKIVYIGDSTTQLAQFLQRTIENFEQDFSENFENCFSQFFSRVIDATGKSVIPGLVDAHTHPVWSGDRTHEFGMKLNGATYMDIHRMGGGIGFTVKHTRGATENELVRLLKKRLRVMLRNGSTVVEAKSGYGLDTENEMKMLKVICEVNKQNLRNDENLKNDENLDEKSEEFPLMIANFLGAHSVPKNENLTMEQYTELVIEEQLKELIRLKQDGVIDVKLIDVFHEQGVFDTESTRKILLAGKEQAGLKINFHGDELHAMGSAELGAEIGAIGISHLEMISEEGVRQMAQHDICAVLLPTTAYVLRIEYPPARRMIDSGVPVVIATDFNPNAHCMSLPFVMNLSCVNMRMTMAEALVACTLNAAASLDISDEYGSLTCGKYGDCVIVDYDNWEHLVYEIGNSSDSVIRQVIRHGRVVVDNSDKL